MEGAAGAPPTSPSTEPLPSRWRRTLTRGSGRSTGGKMLLRYRTARQWIELLTALGLTAAALPMGMGTPYANVLIRATRPQPQTDDGGNRPAIRIEV